MAYYRDTKRAERRRRHAEIEAACELRARRPDGKKWTPAERQARFRARKRLVAVVEHKRRRWFDAELGPAPLPPTPIAPTSGDLAPLSGTILDDLAKLLPDPKAKP